MSFCGRKFCFTATCQRSGKTGICDRKMIQYLPANHSNTNRVTSITIPFHSDKTPFSKRFRYVTTSHIEIQRLKLEIQTIKLEIQRFNLEI